MSDTVDRKDQVEYIFIITVMMVALWLMHPDLVPLRYLVGLWLFCVAVPALRLFGFDKK